MNLCEFFLEYCPKTDDLYVIFNAVIKILVNDSDPDSVSFCMESIDYDRKKKRIRIQRTGKKNGVSAYVNVNKLLEQICSECRYAGKDVSSFADSFLELYKKTYNKNSFPDQCISFLERYNNKSSPKLLPALLFICVMIGEAIILIGTPH